MMPSKDSGKPIISRSHLRATSSSSVAAGAVFQSIALTLNAAQSSSPKMPGADDEIEKYAKNAG